MRSLIFAVMICFVFSISAVAQEIEPILVCDPAEDIQVRWNETGDWIIYPAVSVEIVPGVVVPSTRRMLSVGAQRWYSMTPDCATDEPEKFSILVNVILPEGSWLAAIMRLRVRCRYRMPDGSEPDQIGNWSVPSDKRLVIDLHQLRPGKPESE